MDYGCTSSTFKHIGVKYAIQLEITPRIEECGSSQTDLLTQGSSSKNVAHRKQIQLEYRYYRRNCLKDNY